MPRQDAPVINRMLRTHGLPGLDNAAGLLPALGARVTDHEHLRSLLIRCEPEQRPAMYDSLKPYLSFAARPLDTYIAESAARAEAQKLPTIDAEGALKWPSGVTREVKSAKEKPPMTRQEAVAGLIHAWGQRDSEFCVGVQEYDESRREMLECLRALGCTDAELGEKPAEPEEVDPEVADAESGHGVDLNAAQVAVNAAFARHTLTVTCRSCTTQATFTGDTKYDAVLNARLEGWVYYEHEGRATEICPACPATRATRKVN